MLVRLTKLSARRRTSLLVLFGVIAVLVLAGPLAGKVGEVEDNGPTATLPDDADSTRAEELLPRFDASGVLATVVVYERDGGLTEPDRARIESDRSALVSYAAGGAVSRARVSDDGGAAIVTFGFQTQTDDTFERFKKLRALVDGEQPNGLHAYVTGPAAGLYDSVSVFEGLDEKILAASAAVVVLLLLLTYRSPILWLMPLLSIGFAMTVAQAAIYLLGKHAGLPVDGQSAGILPVLVFGVGTDYALLLISRYREELHHHHDRHRAMTRAVRRVRPAILASAATVVMGLACLLLAGMNSTRSLGAVSAVGVAAVALAMLTVLPLVLTLLGRWVFWPIVPRVDAGSRSRSAATTNRQWRHVARLVSRSPRLIWAAAAAGLAALAVTASGLNVGTTAAEQFRTPPESVVGQEALTAHFPAGNSAPTEVLVEASVAQEARKLVAETPGVARVSPPTQSSDGDWVRYQAVLTEGPDSEAARDTVKLMRDRLQPLHAEAVIGGQTAQSLDIDTASRDDATLVIPSVLAVVLVILVLLLRALIGPLVLLASVLLSYAAALGAGGLLMTSMGFDAVDVSLPLLAFVFLVALGVDYTIFLMARVREEVAHRGHAAGISAALVATGGVITSAGLVLTATFFVLTVMPLVFLIGLGTTVAIGVLLDAFVVRSLLVPGLAIDLGNRFWAPSRHGPADGRTHAVGTKPGIQRPIGRPRS